MATQVQFRGGTTTEHASFNGAAREVTVDTTKQTVVVQDGSTNGGFPLLREKNPDNAKVYFGTGDDLQIYADGSNSYIAHNGDGNLRIFSGSAESIRCTEAGATSLFHNGTEQCYTHSVGLKLNDNKKLYFGIGADLQIYHDGSQSIINDSSNELQVRSDQIKLMTASGKNEYYLIGNEDGAVELYFDGSKKLSTTSSGVQIDDSAFTVLKSHNSSTIATIQNNYGSNATAQLKLISPTDEFNLIKYASGDAHISLSNSADIIYNIGGSERLRLLSDGKVRVPDNGKFVAGSGDDLQLFHDGSHSYISDAGTGFLIIKGSEVQIQSDGGEDMAKFEGNGAVELYYDNAKKLDTYSSGVIVHGELHVASHLVMEDNDIIKLGSSADLQIYHDGTNSYVSEVGTGKLILQGNGPGVYIRGQSGEESIVAASNGAVELYYDNGLRLKTGASNEGMSFHNMSSGAGNADLRWNTSTGEVTYDTSTRLVKTDIEDSPYGIDIVKQLKPRKYKRTDQTTTPIELGFVADEVQPLIPEIVPLGPKSFFTKNDEDTEIIPSNVDYRKLTVVLTTALQELTTKVETLEAKVAALEAG